MSDDLPKKVRTVLAHLQASADYDKTMQELFRQNDAEKTALLNTIEAVQKAWGKALKQRDEALVTAQSAGEQCNKEIQTAHHLRTQLDMVRAQLTSDSLAKHEAEKQRDNALRVLDAVANLCSEQNVDIDEIRRILRSSSGSDQRRRSSRLATSLYDKSGGPMDESQESIPRSTLPSSRMSGTLAPLDHRYVTAHSTMRFKSPIQQRTPVSTMRRSMSMEELLRIDDVFENSTPRATGTMPYSPFTPKPYKEETWLGDDELATHAHTFTTKSVMRKDYCDVCAKAFKFASKAYRCCQCRTTVHGDCRDRACAPCVPRDHLLGSTLDKVHLKLSDIVPASRPMIPFTVIHMCLAIEKRGGNMPRVARAYVMYRPNDARSTLNSVVRNRAMPNLDEWDITQLVGCILQTLALCPHSLLPSSSWYEVANAKDRRSLIDLILELPIANRDTLSFLMRHWLLTCSIDDRLCTALGPLVVGDAPTIRHADQMEELPSSSAIMETLFSLGLEFWTACSDVRNDNNAVMRAIGLHTGSAHPALSPAQQSLTTTLLSGNDSHLGKRQWLSPVTKYEF